MFPNVPDDIRVHLVKHFAFKPLNSASVWARVNTLTEMKWRRFPKRNQSLGSWWRSRQRSVYPLLTLWPLWPLWPPLTAWHGLQQDDIIQPVQVWILSALLKDAELQPRRRRGEEDHGGVQEAAHGGPAATGRKQTNPGESLWVGFNFWPPDTHFWNWRIPRPTTNQTSSF